MKKNSLQATPKRVVQVGLILALVGGGSYAYFQHSKRAEQPSGLASSNGRLELKRIDIASLYPGRVKSVLVNEGDSVQANQVLATLSSESVESKVEAAKAQKQRAQGAVSQAQAQTKALQHQLTVAQMELDNAQRMGHEQLVSEAEVTRRRAARDAAREALNAAVAAQEQAGAAVSQAQAGVSEIASVNEDLNIRAPVAGRVEYRLSEPGNVIAAGSKVVSMFKTGDVSMNVFLPNAQAGSVHIGDEARIVLDSLNAVFPAKVSFVATDAQFTPKAVETHDEREKMVFKVKLTIPEDVALRYQEVLKGGMTGLGYVRTDQGQGWPSNLALKLPN